MRRRADLARHLGADLPGHQRIEAARQLALGLAGKALVQPLGDRQPQHPVAQKLEPLVIGRALTAMRQRALIPREITRGTAQHPRQPVGQLLGQKPSPIRLQRAALNQVHGSSHCAPPSVDQKLTTALPCRFSIGT